MRKKLSNYHPVEQISIRDVADKLRYRTKLDMPIRALFEITTRCNFRCVHCYHPFSGHRKDMSTSQIFSAIDQLADMGVLFLIITGGEPFFRSDFWEIIEYARKKDFAVRLRTNGSFITKDVAHRLADLFLQEVDISIYGMSECTYKNVTGASGVFKKVRQGLKFLTEKGVNVFLTLILLRENFFELESLEKFIKKTGLRYTIGWGFTAQEDGCKVPFGHEITESQVKKLMRLHPELCEPELDCIPSDDLQLCIPGSHDNMSISSDGTVSPCLRIKGKASLLKNPLKEIFKKDKFFKRFRTLRWKHLTKKCLQCKALLYCRPCPANFFLESRDIMPCILRSRCKLAWMNKRMYERIHK
ncbi:MAG: radical SAM protein [Candidatus Omnitrophota bacterium]